MLTVVEPASLVNVDVDDDDEDEEVDSLIKVLFFSPRSCLAQPIVVGRRFWDDVLRSLTDFVREKRPLCSKAYEVRLLNFCLSLPSFLKSQMENAER